jgi:hypothetical protein
MSIAGIGVMMRRNAEAQQSHEVKQAEYPADGWTPLHAVRTLAEFTGKVN